MWAPCCFNTDLALTERTNLCCFFFWLFFLVKIHQFVDCLQETEKNQCHDKERRCDRKEIWPVQAIESLKALGYKTAALALTDDSVSIDDPQLMNEEKLAVILGTEGDGLMQETIKACDYTVKIPMSHGVDSLNVAAASAVAFWQLRK